MAQVNAGRVRFVSRGEYNNSTQYYTLDLVNYDGSSYYAKENVVGVLPTDNTKWQLVAEKGSIGSTGPTGPSGFSPSASVTQLQNGALISITDETGTTTANISNGEVTNKEFDYYKTISNVLPKVEDEDTDITLNNTGNAPLSIGLKGNTYQNSTSISGGDEYDSPSPDHPQDIHVVSGDNKIKIINSNLVKPLLEGGTIDATTGQNSTNISTSRIPDYIDIGNASNIYFKRNTDTTLMKARWYDKSKNYIGANPGIGSVLTATLTPPENAKYLRITVDSTNLNYLTDYKVIISPADTSYIPHEEQVYPINLGNIELCKIGDYQDYLYKENNKWYKYGAIGKVVLDGSETWTLRTDGTFQVNLSGIFNRALGLSNYFYYSRTSTTTGAFYTVDNYVRFYYTEITTVEDFKNWLVNHNTDLYYQLATPEITEITDSNLISQLDAIEYAMSYKEQTNISQENNDMPFIIPASAFKDLSNL